MDDTKALSLIQLKKIILQKAALSLAAYCGVMNPDLMRIKSDPTASLFDCQPHHDLIIDKLEAIARFCQDPQNNKPVKNLIITMPPRHGKSFLAVEHFVPWFVGMNPNLNVIACSYSDDLAVDKFGASVLTTLNSPTYRDIFPHVALSPSAQSKDNMTTTLGGELVFSGLNGGITGKGANLLLLDDPHKNREQAESKLYRDKTWDSFVDDFLSRGNTGKTPVILIMTRWHPDDIVGRLTDPDNPHYNAENANNWEILRLPALAEIDDPLGRAEGEALWPSRFSREDLEKKRAQNPHGFSSLYQGDPILAGGHFFDVDSLRYYDSTPPEGLLYSAALDAGITEGQRSDYSALLFGGFDAQGNFWVHHQGLLDKMINTKLGPAAGKKIARFTTDHTLLTLYMEKGPATAAVDPLLQDELKRLNVVITQKRVPATMSKAARATTLKALMEQGRVFLPRFAPWKEKTVEQLRKFGRGGHDDAVDALALMTSEVHKQIKRQDAAPKPEKDETAPMTVGQMIAETKRKNKRKRGFAR